MKPKLTIAEDGTKTWKLNGLLHREDGPAIIWANGTKCWYIHGQLHRTEGPAIIWPTEEKYWFINNRRLSQNKWLNIVLPNSVYISPL